LSGFTLWLSAMVSLSASSSTASDADEKARGKALLADGLSLMDNGHAQEALAKFEAAYQIVPSPKVLFNMGLAHQALGNTIDALKCFQGFLEELPDAPEDSRAYAERQVERLRADVSFVDISANLPGAETRIDDQSVGLLPLKRAVVVRPGAHVVTIRADGHDIFSQQITTVRGKQSRVFAVATLPPNAHARSRRQWQRTAFWVAAGLSGVALVGGIAEQIVYEGKSSDYQDLLGKSACNVGAPERSNCENLRSEATTARTLAWIGYSTAALSASAALAFWLLEPKSDQPTPTAHAAVACAPSAGLVGISCVGRY
jgi:hypothetical protein